MDSIRGTVRQDQGPSVLQTVQSSCRQLDEQVEQNTKTIDRPFTPKRMDLNKFDCIAIDNKKPEPHHSRYASNININNIK